MVNFSAKNFIFSLTALEVLLLTFCELCHLENFRSAFAISEYQTRLQQGKIFSEDFCAFVECTKHDISCGNCWSTCLHIWVDWKYWSCIRKQTWKRGVELGKWSFGIFLLWVWIAVKCTLKNKHSRLALLSRLSRQGEDLFFQLGGVICIAPFRSSRLRLELASGEVLSL